MGRLFEFPGKLMYPSSDDQDQQGADYRGDEDRPEVGLNNVEVEHQGHTGWHEEKTEVSDQKVA